MKKKQAHSIMNTFDFLWSFNEGRGIVKWGGHITGERYLFINDNRAFLLGLGFAMLPDGDADWALLPFDQCDICDRFKLDN